MKKFDQVLALRICANTLAWLAETGSQFEGTEKVAEFASLMNIVRNIENEVEMYPFTLIDCNPRVMFYQVIEQVYDKAIALL